MIHIDQKENCCGCTACQQICPVRCITMKPDEEGFVYPHVEVAACTHCDCCEQVCPVLHPAALQHTPKAYLCRTRDGETLMGSTSGGAFTPIAQHTLAKHGVVFGVGFDADWQVCHIGTETIEGLAAMRGSKYVQSALGQTFSRVQALLVQGRHVCFSGTPCQVEGLRNYLGKPYERLVTVDVVCHGTPSPKLWKSYLATQYGKIKHIAFRKKTYGYHSGTMEIRYQNGKGYQCSGRIDRMLQCFFAGIASRPACYACAFKIASHASDFTLYDAWHAAQLVPGLTDDDRGYTNVMVHTPKGEAVWEAIQPSLTSYPVDLETAIRLDGSMVRKSAVPHPRRAEFLRGLDGQPLDLYAQRYLPITCKDHLLERSKKFLYRTGLLRMLKKAKQQLRRPGR